MVSQLFQVVSENPFIFILIGCWIIFSVAYISYLWKTKNTNKINPYLYNSIPSVFTTLGVFGTFLGIYLGLQNFNVDEINKSIPTLLEGMKSAFLTSILGIGLSIIFRFGGQWVLKRAEKNSSNQNELSALNQIIQELGKINNSLVGDFDTSLSIRLVKLQNTIVDSSKKQIELLNKVQLALTGNEETSLLTQLANLRSQVNDANNQRKEIKKVLGDTEKEITGIRKDQNSNSDLLNQKFDDFGKMLQKNNTEALVEVMKNATETFNKQMSELVNKLVQENFNELNQSVQNLNTWQQENKEMIGTLTDQFSNVAQDFTKTSTAIKEITENTTKLTNENSHLSNLIKELQKVMVDDEKFTTITEKLENTIDTLKENTETFDETTNKLNDWIINEKNFKDSVDILISRLNEIENIKDINGEFWNQTKHQLNEGVSIISQASKELRNNLDDISAEFTEQLNQTLTSLDALIQRLVKKANNEINVDDFEF